MKKISRRSFLLASGLVTVGAALSACGGSSASTATSSAASTAASTAASAAPAAASVSISLGHFGAANEPVTAAAETFKQQVEAAR